MRTGTSVATYLLGDHLGSTTMAVNASGALVGSPPQLYKAWGENASGERADEVPVYRTVQ